MFFGRRWSPPSGPRLSAAPPFLVGSLPSFRYCCITQPLAGPPPHTPISSASPRAAPLAVATVSGRCTAVQAGLQPSGLLHLLVRRPAGRPQLRACPLGTAGSRWPRGSGLRFPCRQHLGHGFCTPATSPIHTIVPLISWAFPCGEKNNTSERRGPKNHARPLRITDWCLRLSLSLHAVPLRRCGSRPQPSGGSARGGTSTRYRAFSSRSLLPSRYSFWV